MVLNEALFSSATFMWATPDHIFEELHEEFSFDLDVCASPENKKCKRFFTEYDEAMFQQWNGKIWCNPPYGREIGKWIEKGLFSVEQGIAKVAVYLLPARTNTKWFHELVLPSASEIRFIKGRLKFGGSENSAPFPSVVVIFRSP